MKIKKEETQNKVTPKVIIDMAMSLDGFIADQQNQSLYPIGDLQNTEALNELIRTTGAVIMGRHAYDMANGDFTGYEYQVPIFVLTHNPPDKDTKGQNENLKISFVTNGIESAIEKAKAAANDKNVTIIGGANVAQQSIKAGLVDQIQIRLIPVLLNEGLRMFDRLGNEYIDLKKIRVRQFPDRTDMKFIFKKDNGFYSDHAQEKKEHAGSDYHAEPSSKVVSGMIMSLDASLMTATAASNAFIPIWTKCANRRSYRKR